MRYSFLLILIFMQSGAFSQALVEIINPTELERIDEVVEIPFPDLQRAYPSIDTGNFYIVDQHKKQIPYQLETKGLEQVQNLLVQISIKPKSTIRLSVQKGKPQPFESKTFARYVPERKDDFAWENDKIAFRMYGKELEKTPSQMGFGTDVWVKRTDKLIINGWYKRDDYHSDNGEGLDYYKVGLTLGAGDIAPYIDDTIRYSKNYRDWKIIENGPLRTTFQLYYEEWQLPSQKVKCVKTISIDAGSQLNKVEVHYTMETPGELPVAIGIVKRKEPGVELFDERDGIMAYWEPQHGKDGTTGVACITTGKPVGMLMNEQHLLTVTTAKDAVPVIYYNGAAWNKAGDITSAESWFTYLKNFKEKIENPLKIKVSKR